MTNRSKLYLKHQTVRSALSNIKKTHTDKNETNRFHSCLLIGKTTSVNCANCILFFIALYCTINDYLFNMYAMLLIISSLYLSTNLLEKDKIVNKKKRDHKTK